MAAKAYKEQLNNNLATKHDLETVKTELRHETDLIKKDIEHIKHQLNTNVATKAEMAEVKKDIEHIKDQLNTNVATKTEMAEVKTEFTSLRSEIKDVKMDILKWIVPLLVTIVLANVGLFIK